MQKFHIEILLLDDEEAPLEYSRRTIAQYVGEERIHTAQTVEEALAVLKQYRIGMAFLDVELKAGDGFSLCNYIHREYPAVKVVILTGHVDLGAKSYDYEPFDFLVKPLDLLRLEKTFLRYQRRTNEGNAARLAIETSAGVILLKPEQVVCISKNKNICLVHCEDGQEYKANYSMDKLQEMLEGYGFFRTYQSYLVPVDRIRQLQSSKFGSSYEAYLDDGTVVPVSCGKYAKLKEFIMQRSLRL